MEKQNKKLLIYKTYPTKIKYKIMKENLFRKVNGQKIENIEQYILEYISKDIGKVSNMEINIGCDSFITRKAVSYAISLVFYDKFKHNGAHYIYKTLKIPKSYLKKNMRLSQWVYEKPEEFKYSKDAKIELDTLITNRLWNEIEYVLELGLWLDEKLKGKYYIQHKKNNYDDSQPYRLPILHIDFNPINNNKFKSNRLYSSAMGLLSSYGFKVVSKPDAYASSSCADLLCKR